jgi:hypothetical protein
VLGGLFVLSYLLAPCGARVLAVGRAPDIRAVHLVSIPCEESPGDVGFSPLGLAFGVGGELYLIDADNSRVLVLSDSLSDMTVFADCPSDFLDCQFIDVDTDAGGGLYVSEKTQGNVLVFDRWGELAAVASGGQGIAGISASGTDEVYAAMTIEGTLRIVDVNGQHEPVIVVISTDGETAYPVDCLYDRSGKVLTTDAFSVDVLILSALGEIVGRLRGFGFKSPFGLASYMGFTLVTDWELGEVAVFDSSGRFVFSFGKGLLTAPTYIDCRDDGVICVSDPGDMTIEAFRLEGRELQ